MGRQRPQTSTSEKTMSDDLSLWNNRKKIFIVDGNEKSTFDCPDVPYVASKNAIKDTDQVLAKGYVDLADVGGRPIRTVRLPTSRRMSTPIPMVVARGMQCSKTPRLRLAMLTSVSMTSIRSLPSTVTTTNFWRSTHKDTPSLSNGHTTRSILTMETPILTWSMGKSLASKSLEYKRMQRLTLRV